MVTAKRKTRTFQPQRQPQQIDIWYTPLPLDVLWGIYARQSTPAQLVKHVDSTEMQTDDLIEWLVQRHVPEPHISLFDADLGLSGTLRIDQRTGLQELVEQIKADEIKAVLVYQVSRLFRDETGVQYNVFANICKQHNCLLVTSDGMVFNFQNPMHLKMFRFLAEMAAEYIPQQIGLLHAAKIRKARRGKYAGLGAIPSGFIVDYDKDSPTYLKFILYEPHARVIYLLFERFYALGGDFFALCKELNAIPILFPEFTPDVDRRVVNKCRRKKVPGGYHISRTGLLQLLTNPVYIGWWIVQGDIISRENHEPIIDRDHEYFFWYAFNRLSDYTTEGNINVEREKEPRRFYQHDTIPCEGLLKDRITSSVGSVHVHFARGRSRYIIRPTTTNTLVVQGMNEVDACLIDEIFRERFFTHLGETHDFDEYRQFLTEENRKYTAQFDSINDQLTQIDIQQEHTLDEIIATRAEMKRMGQEDEHSPMLQKLRKRFDDLELQKQELLEKQNKLQASVAFRTVEQYADFQTELARLYQEWDTKPFREKKEFVNVLVKQAVLDVVSTHWIRLTIYWLHPNWLSEEIYLHRTRGTVTLWTEEERAILREYYPTDAREHILALLSHKSWRAIKAEAGFQEIRRTVPYTHSVIPATLTWSDWCLMQEENIEPDQSTKLVPLSRKT